MKSRVRDLVANGLRFAPRKSRLSGRLPFSAIVLSALFAAASARGAPLSDRPELPDFDRRHETARPASTQNPDRDRAVRQLAERLPFVQVDVFDTPGIPKTVAAFSGFLSNAEGRGRAIRSEILDAFPNTDSNRVVKAFLRQYAAIFSHGYEPLDSARIEKDYVTRHNGMRTVVWRQSLDGIDVFESVLAAHITQRGELVTLSSRFLADLDKAADNGNPNRRDLQRAPTVSALQALIAAATNVGENLAEQEVRITDSDASDPQQRRSFSAPGLDGSAETKLVWLPMDDNTLRLCWTVRLGSLAQQEHFEILVDAETGQIPIRRSLTCRFLDWPPLVYRVFPEESPKPMRPTYSEPNEIEPDTVEREDIFVDQPEESPDGWYDSAYATRGNNVIARMFTTNGSLVYVDDSPPPGPGGSYPVGFYFPLDLNQDPSTYIQASTVNLFYWCNWAHDRFYALGFDEPAGNCQKDNFGKGGLGNDRVIAVAQDSSVPNDPKVTTYPDGQSPRIRMGVFLAPSPKRASDLATDVILHEYTHIVSHRMVNGGDNLANSQSRGLGEGWSDFCPFALLSGPGEDENACYAQNTYCTRNWWKEGAWPGLTANYYYGCRRYPYTTDKNKNPLTFKDIENWSLSTYESVPVNPVWMHYPVCEGQNPGECHNMGEVWCVTLWDARANLIAKYDDVMDGNALMLQLVIDGMKLTPAEPNFLQARNAILLADQVNNNGANLPQLWAAFGKRGMGWPARCCSSVTNVGIVEHFDTGVPTRTPYDFDGDGRADLALKRSSTGKIWVYESSTSFTNCLPYGQTDWIPTMADYDGDGRADYSWFIPSTTAWRIYPSSSTNYQERLPRTTVGCGSADTPIVGCDFDGDGKVDIAVFRAASGKIWIKNSMQNYEDLVETSQGNPAWLPTCADYDGDGMADYSWFIPSTHMWRVYPIPTDPNVYTETDIGGSTDVPLPGLDFDGDGKADMAVFHRADGKIWIKNSSQNYANLVTTSWGNSAWLPTCADYDGDGKADYSWFIPSTQMWRVYESSNGYAERPRVKMGASTDWPLTTPLLGW